MNELGRHGTAVRGLVDAVWYTTVLIGKQIKVAREEAGLTQIQLARLARVRPETLSRIENGRGNPTVGIVGRIARALERSA